MNNTSAPQIGFGQNGVAIVLPGGQMVELQAPKLVRARRDLRKLRAFPPQADWSAIQLANYEARVGAAVDYCRQAHADMMRDYGITRNADGSYSVDPLRYAAESSYGDAAGLGLAA